VTGADDEQARRERAKRLRRQIDELRSGEGGKEEPQTPREFLEEKAREEREHQERDDGETEEEAEED
jgi:cell division protein FtsB